MILLINDLPKMLTESLILLYLQWSNEAFIRLFHRFGPALNLNFTDLALGTEVRAPTLDGNEKLKIPPGTQPNTILKLKGKGLPHYGSYSKGDEMVRINVKVPVQLNDTQKSLLKELDRQLRNEDGSARQPF
jgi:DnaJ-class molecular chaperone